jgi:hypothetical protein
MAAMVIGAKRDKATVVPAFGLPVPALHDVMRFGWPTADKTSDRANLLAVSDLLGSRLNHDLPLDPAMRNSSIVAARGVALRLDRRALH